MSADRFVKGLGDLWQILVVAVEGNNAPGDRRSQTRSKVGAHVFGVVVAVDDGKGQPFGEQLDIG